MGRQGKTPQEKKQDRYERDHFMVTAYSERHSWPRKKRRLSKQLRARTRELVTRLEDEQRGDAAEVELRAPHRKWVRTWRPLTLRERVELARRKRAERFGRRLLWACTCSPRLRDEIVAFLTALTAERSGEAREHARIVRRWLDGDPLHPGRVPRARERLSAFFRVEPAWEGRLRSWVDSLLGAEET